MFKAITTNLIFFQGLKVTLLPSGLEMLAALLSLFSSQLFSQNPL